MPKSKLSIAFFAFLVAITSAFTIMFLSRFFIPKDVGLAGGAMVLGYGVLGLFAGLVIGLVVQRWLSRDQLKILNRVLGIICAALVGWLIYRINATM